jgi:phosphate-selective porin OprO and OprP
MRDRYARMSALVALPITAAIISPAGHAQQKITIFKNQGGLSMETADGNFSFEVIGRLQADAAFYDDEVADLGSGTELRRTRIGVQGSLYEDWNFKLEYDFAENEVSVTDAYVDYAGFDPVGIRAGNFKEPFSLENLTSSNDLTFMERSLPFEAFLPDNRRLGLGLNVEGARWSGRLAAFGDTVSGDAGEEPDGGEADSGVSIAGRVTSAPVLSSTRLIHVGGAVAFRDTGQGETVQLRTRPESHVTDERLVDTGGLENTDDFTRVGLEGAFAFGPMAGQGEYYYGDVGRDAGDLNFDGWYLQTSYFLTGESRAAFYSPGSGEFKRVQPASAGGAWQVALRYSSIDLNDGPILGGEENNLGVALNWFPNYYLRFSANYIKVIDHERQGVSDEPNIFQMRAQVAF